MERLPENQNLSRRALLVGGGLHLVGGLAAMFATYQAARAPQPHLSGKLVAGDADASRANFSFVHITDPHIQPERGAKAGVAKAFAAIRGLKETPAFALVGGDLVFDALSVEKARAELLYDLWQDAAANLNLPLYHSIGNHDLYDLKNRNDNAEDPDRGKGLWKRRLALDQTYSAFEKNGWLFVTLDSVQATNAPWNPNGWKGALDKTQLRWLDDLLRKTSRKTPIVFLSHMPILTVVAQYTRGTTTALSPQTVVENGKTFVEMIQRHNVKAVLQGHTHVVEECVYCGVRYITGGAICGDWWRGKRLGRHAEGFGVVNVRGDALSWRYVPYGWKAVPK